jgi:hypothetical protein
MIHIGSITFTFNSCCFIVGVDKQYMMRIMLMF